VILVNGLNDPKLEEFFVSGFPAVLLAHNYYGTCISGEKRHKFPAVRCCQRRFGKACLALYFPRRCGGMSISGMASGYALQSARHALLERYRSICTLSNHMAREFQRNTKTQVIPLPAWSLRQTTQAATKRTKNCFVYVGRMTEVKGVEVFLEAAAWLRQERPGIGARSGR
jgi:glycosyltransferase involved in cell wall biosynthesis